MKNNFFKICLILLTFAFFLNSCQLSSVRLTPIPEPPPTAKLRIYVVAITSDMPKSGFWKVPEEEFISNMFRQTARVLRNRGVYEVVPAADIRAALDDQKIANWEWKQNDWSLAKAAGKTLHADYVLCFERSFKINLQQDMILFNLHTGRQFNVSNYLPPRLAIPAAVDEMIRINYQTLFRSAQSDLLRTAINKGRIAPEGKKALPAGLARVAVKQPRIKKTDRVNEEQGTDMQAADEVKERKPVTAKENQLAFEKELEKAISGKDKKQDGSRLVVYDFDAAEHLRIVGLILTEALREEIYKQGGFMLVNRENMAQVMEELKLQQSGLVNEKQAIKLGEWMAASEAITGNFAVLGSLSVIQAKRIDIKTLGTVSLGSLKCKAGNEEELLDNMPELARKLVELQKK